MRQYFPQKFVFLFVNMLGYVKIIHGHITWYLLVILLLKLELSDIFNEIT